MFYKKNYFLLLLFFTPLFAQKIIGLMQVKNEEDIIENSLRALAEHTDGIIVLDDASDDGTLIKLGQLAREVKIEEILVNHQSEWIHGSEVTNRQRLLDAGRRHGGTHFIELDADEVFTTHCAENNWLRKKILALKKGQILQIPIINYWKGFEQYRSKFTDNFPDVCYCTVAYCDDGVSDLYYNLKHSHPGFLHFGRFPHKQPDEGYPLFVYEADINHSLIHLPFINWDNVIIKKVWILMLEIIRLNEKLYNKEKYPNGRTIQDVSEFYETFHNYDDENIELSPVPQAWLNYSFFDKKPYFTKIADSKLKDIRTWTKKYGKDYFYECPYIKKHLSSLLEYHTAYISGWAPELIPALTEKLEANNYKVINSSEFDYTKADCVITINVDPLIANRIDSYNQSHTKKIKLYSIMLEPPHVDWQPYNLLFYNKHDLIFTLDDSFVNHPFLNKYVKINFPQKDLTLYPSAVPFSQRKLLTIINSYKTGCQYSPTYPHDLYQERLNLIDYFSKKPHLFDFYGQCWDKSPYKHYSSFRGSIENKIDVLHGYRFVVCFENSCVTPGYITEKIFDAFIAGTVPIYWGAPNVFDYIPRDCFIDMRMYDSFPELQRRLEEMDEEEYNRYLYAISYFLQSEKAHAFLNTHVAQVITNHIINNM